ncbi:MAG: hypothetical protein KDE28_07805 [Anaerolineales bacterium]|nr:hypothetical protein [Anaerolineales bacterium]
MSLEILMDRFKFTQADLEANRQGHLSAAQQARWAGAGQWSRKLLRTTIPLLVAAFVAVVGLIISLVLNTLVVGSAVSLIIAGLVGFTIRWLAGLGGRGEVAVETTSVGRAEGVVHLRESFDRGEDSTFRRRQLEIGHHTIQLLNKEQFEAIENGARYIVYFMDNDEKWIVSIEER